jgi:hypothetical protein
MLPCDSVIEKEDGKDQKSETVKATKKLINYFLYFLPLVREVPFLVHCSPSYGYDNACFSLPGFLLIAN